MIYRYTKNRYKNGFIVLFSGLLLESVIHFSLSVEFAGLDVIWGFQLYIFNTVFIFSLAKIGRNMGATVAPLRPMITY